MMQSLQVNAANTKIGPREKAVLHTLLLFTVAMVVLPVSTYFVLKRYVFEGIMGYDNGAIGAVVGVVLVVHVIIGLYIWVAINEEQEGTQDKKQE